MPETFGLILAETRIAKGLSLEQVSQDLRIRPTILLAIEQEDYFAMPLKGHSRNMVSAYSRYLGLDSAAMTELFLLNYREFENQEEALAEERPGMGARQPIRRRNVSGTVTPSGLRRSLEQGVTQPYGQGVRSIWDKPTPTSEIQAGFDSRSPRVQRSARNAARRRSTRAIDTPNSSRRRDSTPGRDISRGISHGGSGSQAGGADGRFSLSSIGSTINRLMTTTPLPLVLLVILIVLLLVVWAVAANSCNSRDEGFVPVQTAGNSSADGDDPFDPSLFMPPDDVDNDLGDSYGPFRLSLEPAPDTGPWTEVIVDGTTVFDGLLYEAQEYEVLINCVVNTGQPGNLKVYRGSRLQTWEYTPQGSGTMSMEVIQRPVNDNTTNPPIEGDGEGEGAAGAGAGAAGAGVAGGPGPTGLSSVDKLLGLGDLGEAGSLVGKALGQLAAQDGEPPGEGE